MIRLRASIQAGLKHPFFGPIVLLSIGLLLAFVVFHVVEHGVDGDLLACVLAGVVVVRLLARPPRVLSPLSATPFVATRHSLRRLFGRGAAHPPPLALLCTPLRR